jgi:hypothetical protein
VAGNSRQHKSEKRRKELMRQARQQEKRDRRGEKGPGGGGPPIDWSEAPPGAIRPDDLPFDTPAEDAPDNRNTP